MWGLLRGKILYMIYVRIKELRKENGLTQQQVADAIGKKREVYRRYESGERKLRTEILIDGLLRGDYQSRMSDAYAKHVDFESWLDGFELMDIMNALSDIMSLWEDNMTTQSEPVKNV